MPSHLRLQSSFEAVPAHATYQSSPSSPPQKKQKMSLTQTYYVASTARSKLGREAGRPDHNLRRLVGHANLLDNLMVELADAEREQEAWFNQSIKKNSKPEEPKHIQWIDTIEEDPEEEDESDSDSDDEYDEEYDEEHALIRVASKHSPPELTHDDSDSEDESMPNSPEEASLEYSEKERQQIATTAFYDIKQQQGLEDFIMMQPPQQIAAF